MYYADGADVPAYYERGISLTDLLENYKRYQRAYRRPKNIEMEDTDSTAPSRGPSPVLRRQPLRGRPPLVLPMGRGGIQKLAHRVKSKLENMRSQEQQMVFLAVQNIPFTSTEAELVCHFSACARVARVQIDRLSDGKSTGQALVAFNSRKEANIVLDSLQGSKVQGREVRISVVD